MVFYFCAECHYVQYQYTESIVFIIELSGIMLSVNILSVIIMNVVLKCYAEF